MKGGNLFDGVCERQQRPRHHPKPAVGERLDVEVAPDARVQLHALHAEKHQRLPLRFPCPTPMRHTREEEEVRTQKKS